MQPVQLTQNGTGFTRPVIMDYMQNPFQVSLGCIVSSGGTATFNVEHTFDYSAVFSPLWNGTSATWFANTGITAATTNVAGNYAFPVAAIRLNSTANATTSVTLVITQASEVP